MSFVPGKVGQAFGFNGTNAGVRILASPNLNAGMENGFTIEAWINPADVASEHPIVEWNDGSTYGVLLWLSVPIEGGSGLYLDVMNTLQQNRAIATAPGTIATNVYQHVAATYNEPNGVAALYINGTLVVQQALGWATTPRTAGDLYFGWRPAGAGAGTGFLGAMDEVSIYNRALSSTEIATIYAASSDGKCLIPPSITTQPTDQTVYLGGTATFTVAVGGPPPFSYQWQHEGTNLAGATSTSLVLTNVQLSNGGTYAVRVTNEGGPIISSNAFLTVLTNCDPVCL
ncbi:MAG: hypothetical protein DME26_14505, partial [Verrucomicrobia bacterium]